MTVSLRDAQAVLPKTAPLARTRGAADPPLNTPYRHRGFRGSGLVVAGLQTGCHAERPRRRSSSSSLLAGLGSLRHRRWWRQADGPLSRPHQRLLPATLTAELVALALEGGQRTLRRWSPPQTPRFAGHQHTLQGPNLQQVVAWQ